MNSKILLEHFEWNIHHLREILNNEKTPYYRDACLQRFGFTFDQALKNINVFSGIKDEHLKSPSQYFELAIKSGWLQETTDWHSLVGAYERIKENLNNEAADSIYEQLDSFCLLFEELHSALSRVI